MVASWSSSWLFLQHAGLANTFSWKATRLPQLTQYAHRRKGGFCLHGQKTPHVAMSRGIVFEISETNQCRRHQIDSETMKKHSFLYRIRQDFDSDPCKETGVASRTADQPAGRPGGMSVWPLGQLSILPSHWPPSCLAGGGRRDGLLVRRPRSVGRPAGRPARRPAGLLAGRLAPGGQPDGRPDSRLDPDLPI